MTHMTFDDMMAESFHKDPAYAVDLLNSILEDGEQGELLMALRQMSHAFGGVGEVARQANLNTNTLYRTLSVVLRTMGLRLAVQPLVHA